MMIAHQMLDLIDFLRFLCILKRWIAEKWMVFWVNIIAFRR